MPQFLDARDARGQLLLKAADQRAHERRAARWPANPGNVSSG